MAGGSRPKIVCTRVECLGNFAAVEVLVVA